jgi:hypothetical protein
MLPPCVTVLLTAKPDRAPQQKQRLANFLHATGILGIGQDRQAAKISDHFLQNFETLARKVGRLVR